MAKNILAFFGLMFLTLLIIIGVWLVGMFYDRIGILALPKAVVEAPLNLITPEPVTLQVQGIGKAEWSNPLDALPVATFTPIPLPTFTPVPPMDPAEYRALVLARMRSFADVLKRWLDANNQLAQDNTLLEDPAWLGNMQAILAEVQSSGQALSNIGPAPDEYQSIQAYLSKIRPDVDGLNQNYQEALQSKSPQSFAAAASRFTAIKDDLAGAVNAMIQQGWTLD